VTEIGLGRKNIAAHTGGTNMKWKLVITILPALCLVLSCAPPQNQKTNDKEIAMAGSDLAGRLNNPDLISRGKSRVYRGEFLTDISMPAGGIGTGCIQINGKAEREYWRIFNSFYQLNLPDSFFAVRAKVEGGDPVVRVLQTSAVGPFEAMRDLSFKGEYPFGWFCFEDDSLPVKVTMEVFNPMIPMNEKDSAIPCVIFNLTAKNVTDKTVEVGFLGTQQNAVGFAGTGKIDGRSFSTYGKNRNGIIEQQYATILYMFSDKSADDPGFGDMALAVLDTEADGTALWEHLDALKEDWSDDGKLKSCESAGPTEPGQTIDGALAVNFKLKPRKSRTVTFILTWHFPNAVHGLEETGWIHHGNMYANWWKDALDSAAYVSDNLDDLTGKTRLFHDTLYASNLPHWLLDRISSQASILHSKTCFWAADGYLGLWEGTNRDSGCCYGNCSHVYQYAQLHARLYPSLARRLREQALSYQKDNGNIPNRQPVGGDEIDGQLGEVLGCYREHLTSTDDGWLDKNWPKIKKAMDHAIEKWDPDENGVLAGQQGNTLDGNLGGSTSWLGTMYLAALSCCEKMAVLQDDNNTASRYRRICRAGAQKQNETLWNGEYYIQIPDQQPREDFGNGCHIDQLLGEWWAAQLGLGPSYPPDRIRKTLTSLLKYNFRTNFRNFKFTERKFVDFNDAGMLMITWPAADKPKRAVQYGNEVWTGTEYSAAATFIQNGMLKEGLMVAKAVADRHDGRQRRNIQYEGHSGNPFSDDESGKFYGRAMSVWSILLACQGFIYDGPAALIGFKPVWQPQDHISFFTAAQGWGLFTQKRRSRTQTELIELKFGSLMLKELVFELPKGARSAGVTVLLDGRKLAATSALDNSSVHVKVGEPILLRADSSLQIRIVYR